MAVTNPQNETLPKDFGYKNYQAYTLVLLLNCDINIHVSNFNLALYVIFNIDTKI